VGTVADAAPTAAAAATASGHYPIVLLHGFFGWGRDELLGFKHFGGTRDLEAELIGEGYETVTVAVGPLSSNWDRAAEMYAQLVGGTVDYGAAHAREHRHLRYGRTYSALLPGLGTNDARGQVRRVNVIAHSQGAQTARVLISLIADGSAEERAACPGGRCADGSRISPLFTGDGPQWVHGLATLSGASDGSTLAHAIQNDLNPNSLIAMLAVAVNTLGANGLYDFKLDQFGLAPRAPSEPLDAYVRRVTGTLLDADNQDTAFFDLSLDGAARINRWAHAQPDVTYFAWGNTTSEAIPLIGQHRPMGGTNLFLLGFTQFMGTYDPHSPNPAWTAQRFWENDGIVNSGSMSGPTLDSTDTIEPFRGSIRRGRWQVVDRFRGWDHWDMLGLLDLSHDFSQVRTTYLSAARWLRASE
jgi:triacylglycerol lipase